MQLHPPSLALGLALMGALAFVSQSKSPTGLTRSEDGTFALDEIPFVDRLVLLREGDSLTVPEGKAFLVCAHGLIDERFSLDDWSWLTLQVDGRKVLGIPAPGTAAFFGIESPFFQAGLNPVPPFFIPAGRRVELSLDPKISRPAELEHTVLGGYLVDV